MRGRKPRDFSLAAHDIPILQQIAHSRTLPWFQVQRARAMLAMARGKRVQTVAFQSQCDPSTVWRLCRRYEQMGLEGVLAEAHGLGLTRKCVDGLLSIPPIKVELFSCKTCEKIH